MFDLRENCYLQYAYSSKRRKYWNLDIRSIPCSSNMRNFSRTADIGICNFPGFSQGQNAVIDSLRSISKPAYVVICIRSFFCKSSACCFLPSSRSIRNLPRAATKDQRTKRPEDQGTRGPGDQRMRGPEYQGLRAGSTGSKDHGASPNSRAQAEPTLGKKKPGTHLVGIAQKTCALPSAS